MFYDFNFTKLVITQKTNKENSKIISKQNNTFVTNVTLYNLTKHSYTLRHKPYDGCTLQEITKQPHRYKQHHLFSIKYWYKEIYTDNIYTFIHIARTNHIQQHQTLMQTNKQQYVNYWFLDIYKHGAKLYKKRIPL